MITTVVFCEVWPHVMAKHLMRAMRRCRFPQRPAQRGAAVYAQIVTLLQRHTLKLGFDFIKIEVSTFVEDWFLGIRGLNHLVHGVEKYSHANIFPCMKDLCLEDQMKFGSNRQFAGKSELPVVGHAPRQLAS